MRVAFNADVRQMYNGAVPAAGVDGCRKFLRHIQADAPGIFVPFIGITFGNVVAVVNYDKMCIRDRGWAAPYLPAT